VTGWAESGRVIQAVVVSGDGEDQFARQGLGEPVEFRSCALDVEAGDLGYRSCLEVGLLVDACDGGRSLRAGAAKLSAACGRERLRRMLSRGWLSGDSPCQPGPVRVSQFPAKDLAGCVSGEDVGEFDVFGQFVPCDRGGAKVEDAVFLLSFC
jgi:hypothetical protein